MHPLIALYDPNGNLVAGPSSGSLVYHVAGGAAGHYAIEVYTDDGSQGDYVLTTGGATGSNEEAHSQVGNPIASPSAARALAPAASSTTILRTTPAATASQPANTLALGDVHRRSTALGNHATAKPLSVWIGNGQRTVAAAASKPPSWAEAVDAAFGLPHHGQDESSDLSELVHHLVSERTSGARR